MLIIKVNEATESKLFQFSLLSPLSEASALQRKQQQQQPRLFICMPNEPRMKKQGLDLVLFGYWSYLADGSRKAGRKDIHPRRWPNSLKEHTAAHFGQCLGCGLLRTLWRLILHVAMGLKMWNVMPLQVSSWVILHFKSDKSNSRAQIMHQITAIVSKQQ